MIVLLKLLKKNDDFVIYNYGYDEDKLDGEIKVYLINPINYEIIAESNDERVGKLGTLKALNVIKNAILNNKLKEKMSYQS